MTIWWVFILSFLHSLESIRQCGVALCIVLGFSILSASIGSSVVRDRVTGAKRLQHISGLGYRTYWLVNFLYDMVGFGDTVLMWRWRWKGPSHVGRATAEALILLTESILSGCLYGASSGIHDCFMKGRLRNRAGDLWNKGPSEKYTFSFREEMRQQQSSLFSFKGLKGKTKIILEMIFHLYL